MITSKSQNTGRLVLALTVLALAGAAWFFTRPSTPANAIAIVPARWTFIDPSGLHADDERLAEAVTGVTAARGKLPVVPWRSIRPFQAQPQQAPAVAKETGATRVLALAVRLTGAQSRVTAVLVEPFTGRQLWTEDFYAQDLRTPEAVKTLAETISHDLELVLGAAH